MTPFQQFIQAYTRFAEVDLIWLSVDRTFDHLTPESYIESWITNTKRDLVLEAARTGRTVISTTEVDRVEESGRILVRIRAITAPLITLDPA